MNLRTWPTAELLAFTATLTTRDWRRLTTADFAAIDKRIRSNGCTGVPDFYRECCVIHDWWYRTHRNLDGTQITEAQADLGMKRCIQARSLFGRWSPMAWWRWRGLRKWFKGSAKKAWSGTP